MKLFVGRLVEQVTEEDLRNLFAPYGVESISIQIDNTTKRARGFSFVDISGDATAAVAATNGTMLHDSKIAVKAMP